MDDAFGMYVGKPWPGAKELRLHLGSSLNQDPFLGPFCKGAVLLLGT